MELGDEVEYTETRKNDKMAAERVVKVNSVPIYRVVIVNSGITFQLVVNANSVTLQRSLSMITPCLQILVVQAATLTENEKAICKKVWREKFLKEK